MIRWEYKTETVRKGASTLDVLTTAGREGWEVFNMTSGPEFVVLWYKRPLEP
jgi:hypothetical protein